MKKKSGDASSTSETPPAKPKKKKEATKSREWERERRERLNNCFNDLSKILPTSDNKAITKKMEILQKATTFIKALQQENAELLESGGLEKSWSREVKQLQCQVKELTSRNQQLATLLQEAGGKLPTWVSLPPNQPVPPPLGKRQFLYSNKLTQEDAEKTIEKLTEPKSKKSRKSSPQKEKSSITPIISKKKKTSSKASPKNPESSSSNIDSLNPIKPPSVAQLLNVSSSTNNISKNDNIPSTSGLVLLPTEKPSSMDLSPGILLLKSSTQSNPVTAANNSLSSGGLLIMRPPNLQSQQSSALAPGTCILLPPSNNNNMLQNSLGTPPTSQLAQTTTILTTPIMATGQSNSLVQSSQALTTTSNTNTVTPTYVLTNGNLVSVLPTSSNAPSQTKSNLSKPSLAIVPKVTKENKNANKVPIPKLPKRIIKGNKTTTKKNKSVKAKLTVSKTSNLEPLKSIVPSIAPTEKIESVSKDTSVVSVNGGEIKTPEISSQNKEKEVEEVVKNNDQIAPLQQAEQPETLVKLPLVVSAAVETTNKLSSHKTSYSIDSLCKGKNGPSSTSSPDIPDAITEASQVSSTADKENTKQTSDDKNADVSENTNANLKKDEKNNSSKTTELSVLQSSKLNEIAKKDVKRKEICTEKHQSKSLETMKDNKSTDTSGQTSIDSIPPVSSQSNAQLTFTEPVQSSAPRSFYNTFDHCNEMRNQEFPPAQISPSGFIGPQPPMATVVSAPLSKDGIDQYTQSSGFRNNHEETCREQESLSISENIENQQQNDVLSTGMPSSFSSDIFASLNVPSGHPESISPTAAFLLAFPLVSSSGRTNEMIPEQTDIHRTESCNNTSNSILQLGSIDENQPSGHAVDDINHLSSHAINRHVVDDSHNSSHILQNNHNIINQTNQYNKPQTKVLPSISAVTSNNNSNASSFSSSVKQNETSHMKQFNSHNLLPPMPHTFPMNEHLSDYDAEITSIMSTTTQDHDSSQIHNQKLQRNITTNNSNNNSSSCSAKINEKCRNPTQQFVTPQQQTTTSNGNTKQFIPLSNQNCHQILPETQQHISNDQIQQPIYRPCNTSKNKLQTQHNPYQNNSTVHFSSAQQNDRNTRCNPGNYHQPVVRPGAASITSQPHLKMPPPRLASIRTETCPQKNTHEQTDTSYYIGKLNTNATSETKLNAINSQQRYKTSNVESIPTQTSSNIKTPVISNRFDRNLNESSEISRHNLIPTSTTQPYSYSLFNNEYQASSYLPTHLVTSASTTNAITTEAANSSLASISKPHTASNFGILSWSTLSPMSAPNTQQFPGYINNNNESSCQKQTSTSNYQNSNNSNSYANNENQNKITSYQQSNNRTQISYPPQINKEVPPVPRPPVNWMTTPDIRNENVATHNSFDHTLAPCTTNSNIIQKDTNTNCNSFISNTTYSECSENLGHPWQGSKVTNIQHQNPSNPLPTLVGDLALGPTPPSSKYCGYNKATTTRKQDKDGNKRNEYNPAGSSGSFLSVSQLVDHNIKEPITRGGSSARRTTRPSSKGGSRRDRNKNQNTQQTLHFSEPPPVAVATTYPAVSNWPAPKPSYKTAPSNYSAEALIGLPVPPQQDFLPPSLHTSVDKANTLDRYSQNYSSKSHFPTESANSYFPEPIDTNYQQTTYNSNCTPSNYQSSTNNYMSNTGQTYHGPDITGSSITGTSFTSELGSSNFLFPSTTTSSMGTSRTGFFPSEITASSNTNSVKTSTRNNKRRTNDQTESYQDNSYNGTTNQHNHQEYGNSARSHPTPQQSMVPRCNETSAQNCAPTYHSSRGATVQTTTLPSHSTTAAAAGGSSLTNFNLSTIFPEMNDKVPVPPLPAFVSSKNLGAGAPLLGSSSTDYVLHHPNMSFNNLLGPPSHQVGIGLNQSFPTPSFSNMMPPSLAFSVHEH